MGSIVCPPNFYVEGLTPSTSKWDLFGDRVFTEVKMRSLIWALIQCDWCPYKKGNLNTRIDTQGEPHVKVKAEVRVMLLQRTSKIVSKPPGAKKEVSNRFSLIAPRRNHPELRFLVSDLCDNKFLLLRPPVCGPLLQQPWKINMSVFMSTNIVNIWKSRKDLYCHCLILPSEIGSILSSFKF